MYKYKMTAATFECLTTGQFGTNVLENGKKPDVIAFTVWGKTKKECLKNATELVKLFAVSNY